MLYFFFFPWEFSIWRLLLKFHLKIPQSFIWLCPKTDKNLVILIQLVYDSMCSLILELNRLPPQQTLDIHVLESNALTFPSFFLVRQATRTPYAGEGEIKPMISYLCGAVPFWHTRLALVGQQTHVLYDNNFGVVVCSIFC